MMDDREREALWDVFTCAAMGEQEKLQTALAELRRELLEDDEE